MSEVKINYQRELEKILKSMKDEGKTLKLLLHSCCGPCSSYVLEYLSEYFEITVFYYNPNIYPSNEYWYRVEEQQKIIDLTDAKNPIKMISGKYETDRFYEMAKGLEDALEGGARCYKCYEMRLREAAKIAKEGGFDYFTTTLSISPHKNSQVLNKIGEKVGEEIGVKHLPSDFKKNNGYKRSCEITREYGMYRQDYCGCEFSKRETEERNLRKAKKNLREQMKALSESLDEEYMKDADNAIIGKLLEMEIYKNADSIFCYVGKHPEINTKGFIEKAMKDGKKVSIPYCENKTDMNAYVIDSMDNLVSGAFGIEEPNPEICEKTEPDRIDLVVIPCCTVDRCGNRLGFGRGYYDRYLKDFKGEKVLLIREKQIAEEVPTGEYDISIDRIITEKEVIELFMGDKNDRD